LAFHSNFALSEEINRKPVWYLLSKTEDNNTKNNDFLNDKKEKSLLNDKKFEENTVSFKWPWE